jgi:hypothetical protein
MKYGQQTCILEQTNVWLTYKSIARIMAAC